MRKLFFIVAFLFPLLSLGQKDSTHQTFKIGNCRLGLLVGSHLYFDDAIIPISDNIKRARFKLATRLKLFVFKCQLVSKVHFMT